MTNQPVSVLNLANQVGKRKQTIFKILGRLNIKITKQRNSASRGQSIAYITPEEAQRVLTELNARIKTNNTGESPDMVVLGAELGFFYLIALEPEHDPGRFKVGFAVALEERLRHLRCSAPLLKVVKHWPCKRLWEKTAIDAVTLGCEQLHTEVFRTNSMAYVSERCENFFALMPTIANGRAQSK